MAPTNERAVLLGLIQTIVIAASTRQVTSGDRILTIEELYENAQKNLDNIAHECDLVLADYNRKELRTTLSEWAAWREMKVEHNNESKCS